MNALFLTPLPGTRLWDQMKASTGSPWTTSPPTGSTTRSPIRWPVTKLSLTDMVTEMIACNRAFYSMPGSCTHGDRPAEAEPRLTR